MKQRPGGPILDDLGVCLALDDDDRVTEVLVLAKVVNMATGGVSLTIASNDLDWIAKGGLVAAVGQVFAAEPPSLICDDDDDD